MSLDDLGDIASATADALELRLELNGGGAGRAIAILVGTEEGWAASVRGDAALVASSLRRAAEEFGSVQARGGERARA